MLSYGFISGQVGPPDLRCLEVYPNGDVKLTWIPPPGNTSTFSFYEVYSSISATGPFSLVSSSLSPVSTSTFVHVAATASAQSRYYYVRSAFNNGSGFSVNSDTLRTIFLNLNAVTPALQMTFNQTHKPPLQSASPNFTITKEYPIGTVKNLAVLSATKYADTLDVCRTFINYRVFLADNSGCQSASNLIAGEYYDTKDPDTTRVDSISVLEDGRTVLAWQPPRDKDVISYWIIENPGGQNSTNNYIDSIPGRHTTSYTYTNTVAKTRAVRLYVSALDSCRHIGNFDQTPETMYLIPVYDKCGYSTELNWNAYKGMPGGVLEYRIYYSVNGAAYQRVGATSQTSFIHRNVEPAQNICYFIRVVNNGETITASSNRACFFSEQVPMPAFLYLRSADVQPDNTVQLRMHVDNSRPVTGIEILRAADSSDFVKAGFVAYNGTNMYYFNDSGADAGTRSYRYMARFMDSCGNPRSTSNISKTILLRVDADERNMFLKHLSWSGYEGFSGDVSGYNIYRMVNDEPAGAPIAYTGPEARYYPDNIETAATQGAKVAYRVEAVEGLSNTYGIQESGFSNTVPVYMEGQIFIPNAFAPGGVNSSWRPVTHFIDKNEYRVRVFNRWGHKVFESTDDTAAWDGVGCIQGVYAYHITFRNARGEYKELTGSLSLIR